MNHSGNGHAAVGEASETRWIEIDLSDLGLTADLSDIDSLAQAISHVYERFVPYADEGWEWITFPGDRNFDGWVTSEHVQPRTITAVRLLSRRLSTDGPLSAARPTHGVSVYRTRQLTGRPWTAEPGSKLWRSFS